MSNSSGLTYLTDLTEIKNMILHLNKEFSFLRNEVSSLRNEVSSLRNELRTEVSSLKNEISLIKEKIFILNNKYDLMNAKYDLLAEGTRQIAHNSLPEFDWGEESISPTGINSTKRIFRKGPYY